MVVYIATDVFVQARTDYNTQRQLKHLFTLFEKERLQWYVRSADDDDLFFIPALSSFYEFMRREIAESYKSASRGEPRTLCRVYTASQLSAVLSRVTSQSSVTTREIIARQRAIANFGAHYHELIAVDLVDPFLTEPLQLVVENIESDGSFLKACYRFLAGGRIADLFVNVVSGGGSTIRKILEDWAGTRRVLCIVDGDTIAPGIVHPDKADEQAALKQTCVTHGYHLKVLEKRAIENYLPDVAIKRHRHEKHPYFYLLDVEKDHFHMKDGFDPNSREALFLQGCSGKTTAASLIASPTKIPGFGSKIWRAFGKVNTKAELLARDRTGELIRLVDTIRELA